MEITTVVRKMTVWKMDSGDMGEVAITYSPENPGGAVLWVEQDRAQTQMPASAIPVLLRILEEIAASAKA